MKTTSSSGLAAHSQPIQITRYFDLPLNTLWKAWSEPESFKKWWGPNGYSCPSATLDFREEGKLLVCMKEDATGQEHWSTGTYKEIVPQKKIVMTDSFSDSKGNIVNANELGFSGEWPNEMMVTLEFGQSEGRSSVWLKHEGIPAEMFDDCIKGWEECFDKLEKNLK